MLKRFAPISVLSFYRRRKALLFRRLAKHKTTTEIFSDIYSKNRWGGRDGQFYSGDGSHHEQVEGYCAAVRRFIQEQGIRTVVDIGCGDFRIGARLQVPGVRYVGIDIVKELIADNNRRYSSDDVEFAALDATVEPLPSADLYIIRQVLQHLSNDQIVQILKAVRNSKYILVTEHYPASGIEVVYNKDKPCGMDIRVLENSGVYLDKPPFSQTIDSLFYEIVLNDDFVMRPGESIRTFLIRSHAA